MERSTPQQMAANAAAMLRAIQKLADDGAPCPSNSRLGGMCDLTEDQARQTLRHLVRSGAIRIEKTARNIRCIVITRHSASTGWTQYQQVKKYERSTPHPTSDKERECLCCGKMFDSWGVGNRICTPCRWSQEKAGDNGWHDTAAAF